MSRKCPAGGRHDARAAAFGAARPVCEGACERRLFTPPAVNVGATFRGAYLWKARLQGSLLLGADFTGAEMEDVSAGMAGEKKKQSAREAP